MKKSKATQKMTGWICVCIITAAIISNISVAAKSFWVPVIPNKFIVDQENYFGIHVMEESGMWVEGATVEVSGPGFSFSGQTDGTGWYIYPDPTDPQPFSPTHAGLVHIAITHEGFTPYLVNAMANVGNADVRIIDFLGDKGFLPSWDVNHNGLWDGLAIDGFPFNCPSLHMSPPPK